MSIATEITRLQNAKADIKTAIENKGVTVGNATLDEYAEKISSIQTGTDTSDANATADDILYNKTAYVKGTKVTGTILSQTGKTVTPTKSEQTAIRSGVYALGDIKVGAIPSEYIIPSGSETLTENKSYDVSALASVIVNVASGGGLPAGISAIDFGTINVTKAFSTTQQTFTHKLGVIPDLMIVWSPTNVEQTYSMLCAIRGSQFGWRGSAYNSHYAYHGNSTTTVTWANSNSAKYGISANMTASSFQLASHSGTYYWRAGTYNYIAIKF